MLVQLWMMTQLVVLMLSIAIGAFLPQSSVQAVLQLALVMLVGAAFLAPLVPWLAARLVRVLALLPRGPLARPRPGTAASLLPGAPGTPGAALARAPSIGFRPTA